MSFFCPPKRLGTGQRLRGGDTYQLRVPADVPVQQFWSVTAYDHETAALIRRVARASPDSYDTKARKNAEGTRGCEPWCNG